MGTSPRIRLIAVSATLLLTLVLFLQACNRSDASPTPTPRSGGVVDAAAQNAAAPQGSAAEAAPTPTPVVFVVGERIVPAADVTLYAAAASASSVLELYAAGTEFTVMEPTAEFGGYPVSSGGASWVRLRAPDGLAGWARADHIGQ